MDVKTTAVFVVAGAVIISAMYSWLPRNDQEQSSPPVLSHQEFDQLKTQLAELDRQHKITTARLAELEAFLPGSTIGETPPLELEVSETETTDTPSEPIRRERGRNSETRVAQIEEAGMTVEEFTAIEEHAYSLYLEGLEAEWAQRRDRYLKGDYEPSATERLRESLGDDAYDRYLYASGRTNRVQLRRVLPGSAAEQAGLTNRDVVLSYADQRVFSFEDLRRLSYEGEIGEQVLLEVQRSDGSVSQVVMSRGPMGISGGGWRGVPDQ